MSARQISMEEWQQAVLVDWATRFCLSELSKVSARQRRMIVQRLERMYLGTGSKSAPGLGQCNNSASARELSAESKKPDKD